MFTCSCRTVTHRFLRSDAPLKALLGTAWIRFSLRSLKGEAAGVTDEVLQKSLDQKTFRAELKASQLKLSNVNQKTSGGLLKSGTELEEGPLNQ